MPKVSIVIPVYKVEKYIERCVRSLFEQTLDSLEYIFIDDCSPDNSISVMLKVLEEYPHRKKQVKIIRHEVNLGVGAARNHGVAACTGDYVIHCDPDDWLEKNMYEIMYNEAVEKKADMVYCNHYSDTGSKRKICKLKSLTEAKDFLFYLSSNQEYMSLWSKIYKREICCAIMPRLDDALCMNEDFIYNFYALEICSKISHVSIPGYHYFFNTSSLTKMWKRKYVDNLLQIHDIVAGEVQKGVCSPKCLLAYEQSVLFAFLRHPEVMEPTEFLKYKKEFFRCIFIWTPMAFFRKAYLIVGFWCYPLVKSMLKLEKMFKCIKNMQRDNTKDH